eukprot:1268405-Amphidinium_carterae.1
MPRDYKPVFLQRKIDLDTRINTHSVEQCAILSWRTPFTDDLLVSNSFADMAPAASPGASAHLHTHPVTLTCIRATPHVIAHVQQEHVSTLPGSTTILAQSEMYPSICAASMVLIMDLMIHNRCLEDSPVHLLTQRKHPLQAATWQSLPEDP